MMIYTLICASCENPWMVEILGFKTITFDSNGGSHVPSQDMIKGQTVKRPQNPLKSGYTFDAWYIDNGTFKKKYNFNAVPTEGFTLYAKWNSNHVHEWNEGWTEITPATETKDGIEAITCKGDPSHIKETRKLWATGTAGLDFVLFNDSNYSGTNNAYRVSNKDTSNGIAEGVIVIPAYHRENAESPYLPVTEIGYGLNTLTSNAFGGGQNTSNTAVTGIIFAAGSRLTAISGYAFHSCTNLTNITIPEGVTSISNTAFYNCTNLTSITLPDSVTSIGGWTFQDCTALTSITIPAGVTSIGSDPFTNCTNLKNITIDNDKAVTYNGTPFNSSINWGTIFPASGLSVTFTKNVVEQAFNSAGDSHPSITSVTIAKGVTTIGQRAFCNCTGLTSVTIADTVTSIGEYAFWSTGITSVTIPASVTSIGDNAFTSCTNLTSVTFNVAGSSFATNAFDGDLRDEYLAGGRGTYTRSGSGTSATWTKQ